MDIILADYFDSSDPHGYCRLIKAESYSRFVIPHKRRNLGNEIQELHIMNDSNLIPPSTTGYFEKQLICNFIDDILGAQKSLQRNEADSARRKLFFPSRTIPRKAKITHKRTSSSLAAPFEFRKTQQDTVVVCKIKKNYLDEARNIVISQIANERLPPKRSRLSSTSSSLDSSETVHPKRFKNDTVRSENVHFNPNFKGMFLVKTDSGVFPIDPSKLSEICKYHDNMARQHPVKIRTETEQMKRNMNTEACRLSRRVSKLAGIILEEQYRDRTNANNKIVEESIRSIHYLKSLLDMLLERS